MDIITERTNFDINLIRFEQFTIIPNNSIADNNNSLMIVQSGRIAIIFSQYKTWNSVIEILLIIVENGIIFDLIPIIIFRNKFGSIFGKLEFQLVSVKVKIFLLLVGFEVF